MCCLLPWWSSIEPLTPLISNSQTFDQTSSSVLLLRFGSENRTVDAMSYSISGRPANLSLFTSMQNLLWRINERFTTFINNFCSWTNFVAWVFLDKCSPQQTRLSVAFDRFSGCSVALCVSRQLQFTILKHQWLVEIAWRHLNYLW